MSHAITFVDDRELPDGQDFLFISHPDGAMIFYRQSALSPAVLESSWAAYRATSDGGDWRTPTTAKPSGYWPALSLVANG